MINASINLTHTRGRHTYKMGVMREDELQLCGLLGNVRRAPTLRMTPSIRTDRLRSGERWAGRALHGINGPCPRRSASEDLGGLQDILEADVQHVDLGLRIQVGTGIAQGGEASVFSDDRFDPKWGGNPPVFYQPVLQVRRAWREIRKLARSAGHVLDGAGNRA